MQYWKIHAIGICTAIFATFAGFGCGESKPKAVELLKPEVLKIVEQIVAERPQIELWEEPEINSMWIYVKLRLQFTPTNYAQVQEETDAVCERIVIRLQHIGINARKEWLAVHVDARRPASQSITGADQVTLYGESSYSFAEDRVTFEIQK